MDTRSDEDRAVTGGRRRSRWLSTLAAITLLAVIAAVLVPPGRPGESANESAALTGLRAILIALQRVPRTRTITDLHELSDAQLLDPAVANAHATQRGVRAAYAGYWYVLNKDGSVCAYPNIYPHEGRSTFIAGGDGVVWAKDVHGAPALGLPQEPAKDGWQKVEPAAGDKRQ